MEAEIPAPVGESQTYDELMEWLEERGANTRAWSDYELDVAGRFAEETAIRNDVPVELIKIIDWAIKKYGRVQ